MTWQGITWVYCSEIFPFDIRLLCVAITVGLANPRLHWPVDSDFFL